MVYRLIIFLILNFASIGLGRFLGGEGPKSEWYASMHTAPWTPSGLIVGLSWTVTLICFSIYLAYLWPLVENRNLFIGALVLLYILAIAWNPIFFNYQQVLGGLFVIAALTAVVGFFLFYYWPKMGLKSLLVAAYFLWLLVATSLNAYVLVKN
ncbi:TspO/MBR family protein [Aequorivita capsosiphonis]|uniref:TspO/MBR family protein n=1 Tax=Aequorivita capsosiphonis TaxID=487317 RepID=UPI000550DB9C|nr:TspO/MBR family protein [Aequorivita capsosiphonis]